MRVVPVPCLRDNYSYLVVDPTTREAAAVDPAEAEPMLAAARREGVEITAIWCTHHHFDHVGGIQGLCAALGDLEVLGSAYDQAEGRIPRQTKAVDDGDRFPFADCEVEVLGVPGHTLGHIAFLVDGNLLCGDALFLAGCGRVFEGTMEMMSTSLRKLRELPSETRVWCAHEYTLSNLRFAVHAQPDNAAVARALADAEVKRERGEPTIPGTIGAEREVNPFFRFDLPELARGKDPVASFTALRSAKDDF